MIAATNENLEEKMKQGKFREDFSIVFMSSLFFFQI